MADLLPNEELTLGVVILAAGRGKRMHSHLPKILHQLAGRFLLDHVIQTAQELNPNQIVIVVGFGGEQVRAACAQDGLSWVEQHQQLGTAHALQQALPLLNNVARVLVLYGDVPLITKETLQRLRSVSKTTALGLLTAQVSDPSGYGRILRDATGRIIRIVEEPDATPDERAIQEINTGFLIAERVLLEQLLDQIKNNNAQGEYYLTDLAQLASQAGVAIANTQPDQLIEITGINDRVQLAMLERIYQRSAAEKLMRAGVTLMDPARFDLRGILHAESDVTIDINVIIEGEVWLATGVKVGSNCVLKNCKIGSRSEIFANCVIDGAQVAENTRVGPFARLRPGTYLDVGSHVGNFVELKQTKLGPGSKANHLTYLGDAEIGAAVNIGAGTITCNYDGFNKFSTQIGAGAFIGSNTALVAPVKIGERATIGAGSVITRNTPPDQLTLARARQKTIVGWRHPDSHKPVE